MERIKARVQQTRRIYIHNDLSNAAFHFKELIEAKLKAGDRLGISFDYLACALMLAFTFEAKINFMGWKLIDEWKEFQSFDKKVIEVFEKIGVTPDWTKRPFLSIQNMKTLRDAVAHGKPQVIEVDKIVVAKAEELDRNADLSAEWEKACTHEAVMQAYEDVDIVWKEILERSGLKIFDTMTQGEGGISFIEKVVEEDVGTKAANRSS